MRCTTRCVITSKKEGGISISNMHKMVATFSLNIGLWFFHLFIRIHYLATWLLFGRSLAWVPLSIKGVNVVWPHVNHVPSCQPTFQLTNVLSKMRSSLRVPLELQSGFGKCKAPSHLTHSLHVAPSIVLGFCGFQISHKCGHIFCPFKSHLTSLLSFSPHMIQIMCSHTFFWTCITFMQCLVKRSYHSPSTQIELVN
jgi:hypothetical protein